MVVVTTESSLENKVGEFKGKNKSINVFLFSLWKCKKPPLYSIGAAPPSALLGMEYAPPPAMAPISLYMN